MKIFRFLAVALVAMLGFTACEKHECDFIEVDHSADLVGTWTYLSANYAEALVIKADGSVVSTGVEDGEYWDGVKGTIKTVNNKMTLTFEDGDNYEGRFEMLCGEAFTIFNEEGDYMTYRYCANDLADEVVGMWAWVDSNNGNGTDNMAIQTYKEDGTAIFTAFYEGEGYTVNNESTYRIIGDLLIQNVPNNNPSYMARRLIYNANATALGDVLTSYDPTSNKTLSWLRINQSLDLAGQKYDYIKTYVSNVKGEDKDVNFMGYTINFAKMDGSELDKLLKALLFAVEFPDANTLTYTYHYNNVKETLKASIVVEGNKMTIKMSEKVPTLKDVVLYAFQDADCSQLHFYMHRNAFVDFHTNMQAMLVSSMDEQFDITNAEAVNAIYNEINNAVETINVSLVMSK